MISRRQILEKQRPKRGQRQLCSSRAPFSPTPGAAERDESPLRGKPKIEIERQRMFAGKLGSERAARPAQKRTNKLQSGATKTHRNDEQDFLSDAQDFRRQSGQPRARDLFAQEQANQYSFQFRAAQEEQANETRRPAAPVKRAPLKRPPAPGNNFDPYSVYGDDLDEEEDVWYSEERLFEDHIQEIADKWLAIEDEIWAKIICLERNRRIAKAYARKRVITVNGSEDDYLDGTTLGLNSFENPDRDSKTSNIKQYIGKGIRISIDQTGDIFIERLSKANVFAHQLANKKPPPSQPVRRQQQAPIMSSDDSYAMTSATDFYYAQPERKAASSKRPLKRSFGSPLLGNGTSDASRTPSSSASSGPLFRSALVAQQKQTSEQLGCSDENESSLLELDRVVRVFSMDTFKEAVERESKRSRPNHALLKSMCISVISFVLDDKKLLNLPSWIMIINMVAIDLMARKIGLGLRGQVPLGWHQELLASNSAEMPYKGHREHGYFGSNEEVYRKFANSSHSRVGLFNPLGLLGARTKATNGVCAASGSSNANDYYRIMEEYDDDDEDDDEHAFDSLVTERNPLMRRSQSNFQLRDERLLDEQHANVKETNSDGGDSSHQRPYELGQGDLGCAATKLKVSAGGSSSSGFNSHCSLQNDESTGFTLSTRSADISDGRNEEQQGDNASTMDHYQKRGLRRPKLPQGIAESSALVSAPIPIPAPPTSAGGPSGTANLILVSPTGLSPPLQKREFIGVKSSDNSAVQHRENIKQTNSSKTTKHLPAGIPPHAQLAPPATQSHIMRYLMSAVTRGVSGSSTQQSGFKANATRPAQTVQPINRLHRPLPVVPGQPKSVAPKQKLPILHRKHENLRKNSSDESLYYCGLQARVPKHTGAQNILAQNQPCAPNRYKGYQCSVTKSAINAILADLKLHSHSKCNNLQNCPGNPTRLALNDYHHNQKQKQHFSLTNLKSLSSSASALVQNRFRIRKTNEY